MFTRNVNYLLQYTKYNIVHNSKYIIKGYDHGPKHIISYNHDYMRTCKQFPHNWPFVWGICLWRIYHLLVAFEQNRQSYRALMVSLIIYDTKQPMTLRISFYKCIPLSSWNSGYIITGPSKMPSAQTKCFGNHQWLKKMQTYRWVSARKT